MPLYTTVSKNTVSGSDISAVNLRDDEWSLRAVASMPSTAIFLRARAEIKKIALRAASRLESTTRER